MDFYYFSSLLGSIKTFVNSTRLRNLEQNLLITITLNKNVYVDK